MTDAMRAARDRWLANPDCAGAGAAFEAGWYARGQPRDQVVVESDHRGGDSMATDAPASIPDQEAFNNRVVDWIEGIERWLQLGKHMTQDYVSVEITLSGLKELRDCLLLMNRERKNLRAGIEDTVEED